MTASHNPPSPFAGPAINVDRLRVVRGGKRVIQDISLTVARGRITGLLGPSGSGKTTLMRSIVGVQVIAQGSVDVFGHPAGRPELRRRVGYLTQAPSIYHDLTLRENLTYFRRVLGAPKSRIDEVLGIVELTQLEHRVVRTLSGGELSRASLATALLAEPELLVLDEPTVGLDPVLRRNLWRTFKQLANQGTTLLVSSHVMNEAEQCHTLLLMREGQIIAGESPASLRRRTGCDSLDDAFLALVEAEQ